ncbi:cupin domain-containing protein [Microbacterium sp. RD1]|uniref:cupin domain-containing protein n=1 Tax=Microbacterium sp. RD1 TaxID=3457313 RepID=UPI003FA56998
MQITRVVTEVRSDGTSGFVSTGDVPPVETPALAGFRFFPLWATEDHASLPDGQTRPYFPGPDGTRLVGVTWAPAGQVVEGDGNADPAEAEALLPGLLGVFEDGTPFHTTDSIDYGICLSGEMWLVLDEGREVRITPGTVVVQRGTRHAWENRGDQPATMVFAQIGGDPSRY